MSLDTDIQTGRIGGSDDRYLFPELADEEFLRAVCEEIDGLSATQAVLDRVDGIDSNRVDNHAEAGDTTGMETETAIAKDSDFESKHPRGQPGNAGEFAQRGAAKKAFGKASNGWYGKIGSLVWNENGPRNPIMDEKAYQDAYYATPQAHQMNGFNRKVDAFVAAYPQFAEVVKPWAKELNDLAVKVAEEKAAPKPLSPHERKVAELREKREATKELSDKVATAIKPVRDELRDIIRLSIAQNVAKLQQDLEEAKFNLDVARPWPRSMGITKAARSKAIEERRAAEQWVQQTKESRESYGPHPPHIVEFKENEADRAKTIAAKSEKLADESFASYVFKLTDKITQAAEGKEVVNITHRGGGNVWGWSHLTAALKDGTSIHLETKQIINVSSLGKLFNQWPTRIAKAEEIGKAFDESLHPRDSKGEFTAGPVEITRGDFSARYERVKSGTTGDFYQLRGWKYQDDGKWHRVTNRATKGTAGFPLFVDKEMGMFEELEAAHRKIECR